MASGSREQKLAELLTSLMNAPELRQFLRFGPKGAQVIGAISGENAPPDRQAAEAVVALDQRGLVDGAFFQRLVVLRAAREREIRTVQRLWVWGPAAAFQSAQDRDLSTHLEQLSEQRTLLEADGADTAALLAEILETKRKLRDGPELRAGDILGGRYKLLEVVGRGGFGTVWRAFDRVRGALVAIKLLHGQWSRDQSRIERFFRGAKWMALLDHPHVVRVFSEHGEEGGYHYFVMEYLPGGDLRQAVLEDRLSRAEALDTVITVGAALQAAHDKKLVHRDIKPHNILLAADGSPRLTDFDLVKTLESTAGTRTSTSMGAMVYASPEQWADAACADFRSDLYSLGMTTTFCLCGRDLPRRAMFAAREFLQEEGCAAPLLDVVCRALRENPDERFESVREFCSELKRTLNQGPLPMPQRQPPVEGPPPPRETGDSGNGTPAPSDLPPAPAVAKSGSQRRRAGLFLLAVGVLAVSVYAAWPDGVGESSMDVPLGALDDPPTGKGLGVVHTALQGTGHEMLFVGLTGGEFSMGCEDEADSQCYDDEKPRHRVRLGPYLVGRTEVTQGQWKAVMGSDSNPSSRQGDDSLPVENVTWCAAARFTNALSVKEGRVAVYEVGDDCESGGQVGVVAGADGYRLPTEAEWEYAARAGTTTRYWSGQDEADLARVGWYDGNSSETHSVGQKDGNAWGLVDVHGNVYELCHDAWSSSYAGLEFGLVQDPRRPAASGGADLVIRGGSFDDSALGARSAFRRGLGPWLDWRSLGFRVVLPQ